MAKFSYEQTKEMLEELVDELPQEFFQELNLGIVLEEDVKMHPESVPEKPLYVLGTYSRNQLGKQVAIYYGSFERTYAHLSEEQYRDKLRETLRHEFRHHVEYLAGERDLEIYDQEMLQKYYMGIEREVIKE